MVKFLKFLFVVFIWLLVLALVVGSAVLLQYEPIEHAFYFFAGLVVLWYGSRLLWRLIIRYRAKRRVEQLVNVETPPAKNQHYALGFRWWRQHTEMESRFKGIIDLLKSSSLKEYGDPLYVLPWYLVLGKRQSRQDELLASADIPRPSIDSALLECPNGDSNWHLYNHCLAVEVSSAARDSSQSAAKPEWIELLSLLKSHRSIEPLNGVVVSLSVMELINNELDHVVERAKTYRRLIEDCHQLLNIRVPVTVVITGFEQLKGFKQLAATLTAEQRQQMLGKVANANHSADKTVHYFVSELKQIIQQTTLVILKNKRLTPEVLSLSEKIREFENTLSVFVSVLFEDNVYETQPLMSGIFLTAVAKHKDKAQTEFVHDLFEKFLPSIREHYQVIKSQRKKRLQHSEKMAIGTGAFSMITLSVLFSLYQVHEEAIDNTKKDYYGQYQSRTSIDAKIGNLIAYNNGINQLRSISWFPWYLPLSSPPFITAMQSDVSQRLQSEVLAEVERLFQQSLGSSYFADDNIDDTIKYIEILVRRINILQAFSSGAGLEQLETMPAAYGSESIGISDNKVVVEFNKLYLQSLIWQQENPLNDITRQKKKLRLLREQLHRIVSSSDNSLNWLLRWAEGDQNLQSYSIAKAWFHGGGILEKNFVIKGLYTKNGREKLVNFIDEIKQALGSQDAELKVRINQLTKVFLQSYDKKYLSNWKRYATQIPNGTETLRSKEEWGNVANNLDSGQNIYFQSLDLMEEQLSVIRDVEIPDWLALIRYYQEMKALGPDDGTDNSKRNKVLQKMLLKTIGKLGPVGKAIAKQGKGAMKTQKKLAKASAGNSTIDLRAQRLEQAAKLLQDYKGALKDFVNQSDVRTVSFEATKSLFTKADDPGAGASAFGKAYASVQALQALIGKSNRDNKIFWHIYMGSIGFMLDYMLEESNCYVNDYWRNVFLADLESVPEYKKEEYLLGDSGSLWALLDGELKPFLNLKLGAGYNAKEAVGKKLKLDSGFYEYITRAREASRLAEEYTVNIKALPTTVNSGAIHLVQQTDINLNCSDGPQVLENENFPVYQKFKWTEGCADTSITFNFGHLTAKKSFSGKGGFYQFLSKVRNGKYRFRTKDFETAKELEEIGVKNIDVELELQGASNFLKDFSKRPPSIPQNISNCWS